MRPTDATRVSLAEPRPITPRPSVPAFLRRLLVENAFLKLVSLALAAVIWYSVVSLRPRDITLVNVPLQIVNRGPDTIVTGAPYKVVDLRVRGPLKRISHISPESVLLLLDVSTLGPGTHSVWIDPSKSSLPEGVEALRADPISVPVTIERASSKAAPDETKDNSSAPPLKK